ncbi:MAG: Ni/Fe-hydrogenase cytochrome b subunit [Elusimicrobia bacterium]|nr:Ni/Fe-hydrogenase cytochrome b subunit [Elusimicrobiota bacterium]
MIDSLGWLILSGSATGLLAVTIAVALDRRPPWLRTVGLGSLAALWALTAVVLVLRFTKGIGAVSAMSDRFPWGVWIGIDVMSGVALAAGGYTITASVHLFKMHRFEPILRPTVLTAFLGYILVSVALLIDIGRPYRIWHPLVMWQHHSIMFEVAWCVTIYLHVLALEFSPVVFETLKLAAPMRLIKLIAIPLVIFGVILSTLHQSSLGSLFLIVPEKLYPLWYSPLLPVFFLISSVAAGLCMTVVESFFSSRIYGRSLEMHLLSGLGRAAGWVLWLYVAVRAIDLTARGAWPSLTGLLGLSFLIEYVGCFVLPALLLTRASILSDGRKLFFTAITVVGGVVLNRLNVSWLGMLPTASTVYFPSWGELSVTLSFITAGVVAFGLAVRFLHVFPAHEGAVGLSRERVPAVLGEVEDDELVAAAARSLGVTADPDEVAERVARVRERFGDDASFRAWLAAAGMDLAQFTDSVSDQVLRETLVVKARGLVVTDEEVRECFRANAEKLAGKPALRLRHILVHDGKDAEDLLAVLHAGADFARVASQVSEDETTRERGGDLGLLTKGLLHAELEKAAASLKVGETGGVVHTQLGYHLLRLEAALPARPADFDEVKEDLKTSLLNDKVTMAWPLYLAELRGEARRAPSREAAENA